MSRGQIHASETVYVQVEQLGLKTAKQFAHLHRTTVDTFNEGALHATADL